MTHLLGTDHAGRDVLSRLSYGTRVLVASVVWSVLGALLVSLPVGYIIGSRVNGLNKAVDQSIAWLRSIPALIRVVIVIVSLWLLSRMWVSIVLVLVVVLGVGDASIIVAVTATSAAFFTWVIADVFWSLRRSGSLRLVNKAADARPLGAIKLLSSFGLNAVLRHLPLNVAMLVCVITYLQFLGILAYPSLGWGVQLADGRSYVGHAYWATLFPLLLLLATVLSLLGIRAELKHWIDSPKSGGVGRAT